MVTFRSALLVLRREGVRGLLAARGRDRLARAVRNHARREREHCHRAGVVEFASVAARTALYDAIAQRLEELDRPIAPRGLARIESLLAEPPPFRDYGPAATARNARIATILADLEVEHADGFGARDPAPGQRAVEGNLRLASRRRRTRRA